MSTFVSYLFSHQTDKELYYIFALKAPSGLPVVRGDTLEFDTGAPSPLQYFSCFFILCVSVWCSAEVTLSVNTLPTIMLDKCTWCWTNSIGSFPRCAEGQGNTWRGELKEEISEEYHLLFHSFYLFCGEARLPEVSFFWASLMEQDIIMSWPVNNCMPQWDICHHDMQYVLHPDGPWPNREVPLLFFFSPTVPPAIY